MPQKIDFLGNSAVYLDTNGQLYFHNSVSWGHVANEPANLVDALLAPGNQIVALDKGGSIYRYSGGAWAKDPVASNVVDISRDDFMNLWCVNTAGTVYRMANGTPLGSWQQVWVNPPQLAGGTPPGIWEYVVKAGDWLWQIVRNEYKVYDYQRIYGIVEAIKQLNPSIGDGSSLAAGTRLKMPPK